MDNLTLMMITLFIISVVVIIIVLNFIQSRKNKRIKKILEHLEIEKNKLDSSPIIPELAKVESFLNNEKLEVMYDEWTERLQEIRDNQIPKLTDMILEAEYSLSQMDYKSTMYKIAKLEMEIYKVRTNSEFLLGEIKEITSSEERSRAIITNFKIKYRELYEKFQNSKASFGNLANVVENQFDVISKRFEDFESIMDHNEYTEVNSIIKIIDDLIKHINVVIDELPDIILMSTTVLPKKIQEVNIVYKNMIDMGYSLDYLNVEYNIEEANTKIKDILTRAKDLNLEESLFDLKILTDYFDSLFNDFEKEKIAREKYNENNIVFNKKLHKINVIIDDIFEQIDDLVSIYNLSDDDINILNKTKEEIVDLNDSYKILLEHTDHHSSFAYSQLLKELEGLGVKLSQVEEQLNNCLDKVGTMKDDEIRARQQLDEIKAILREAKLKIREYNLPIIPHSYYVELKEASAAIKEIIRELSKKPITIDVLNTRVDTARDLSLKLYTKTKELIKTAAFAEMSIVYGNRYRSSYEGLNEKLNLSERLFLRGEYQKSLELTISLLNKIEPGIYDKLLSMYS